MKLRKLFLVAAAASGAVPGVAIILKGVGAPPDSQILFAGVIEALGTLSLLILWLNRKKISRASAGVITAWAVRLGMAAMLALLLYITLFGVCVHPSASGATYFPVWTSGELETMINRSGSRDAAIERYGIDAVHDAIRKMPTYSLPLTTVCLLILLLGGLNSMTIAFAIVAFHERADL